MASNQSEVFNYTDAIKAVCADICRKMPEFQHIDVGRVAFGIAVAKNRAERAGEWADVTPMRFKDGWNVIVRKTTSPLWGTKTRYLTTQQVLDAEKRPFLYIMPVMVPRFYNLTAKEKLRTIMHELYHISPNFDGDVRRFPGRNWQHGSKQAYNARAEALAQKWLETEPDPTLYGFLALNQEQLCERFKRVVAWKCPRIKIVEITRAFALELEPRIAELEK